MPQPPLAPRTRIKMCGLTREADVDAAIAAGADAIGFVLYAASPRGITPARAGELAHRLPPFVTPVLLFVNASLAEVRAGCAAVPGAVLQFHGDETPEACETLAAAVQRPFLRAARIPLDAAADFDLLEFARNFHAAQGLLLDAHVEGYGGGGKAFNWSRLSTNVNAHLVLSGGLTSANVTDGIRCLRSLGLSLAVDVSSGIEALDSNGQPQKGIKDAQRMRDFVSAVRQAEV
ncbi:N-(5'-phosphoribosyl)anthranilate isomerase [Comamonas serinivorans]|uniref:N-(5'-phosphoribosyl)anthranilate isomerase n=1 Tax=Comamonas serinivorans TaxID=1082851 RepID=A0A1Y0EQJ5_9BURK|nr:phosphoribosylanthranilate isomerase [Comamonas serinivorans]ARU05700.1 N-(5'-phosphoribosyl)anthranilate isomerase [Comamonas serinivorans]